uniref:Uncharacterized protein n=1 Tax=Rhizophora mucronata TaxID=61149 RepID=A0A2P2PQR4_RHIMU
MNKVLDIGNHWRKDFIPGISQIKQKNYRCLEISCEKCQLLKH